MSDCIFCKIAQGAIPATLVYQDDALIALKDIHPQAPVHVLIVPRAHLGDMNDLTTAVPAWLGRIPQIAAQLAAELGVATSGYRLVCNCGPDAGQTVDHLHFHLLGGRPMAGQMV